MVALKRLHHEDNMETKFKIGDNVAFFVENVFYEGEVVIVDRNGSFDQIDNPEPSYDIMAHSKKFVSLSNKNGDCLMKHVRESSLLRLLSKENYSTFIDVLESRMPTTKECQMVSLTYKSKFIDPSSFVKEMDFTYMIPIFEDENSRKPEIEAKTILLLEYDKKKGFRSRKNFNKISGIMKNKRYYF